MSAATHTPGPWVVRTLENFGFNVVHYNGGDKFDIIRVAKCGEAANARLIAAAPDLYEALKWALAELNGQTRYDEDVADQQIENCYALAQAALAKARPMIDGERS